jgi:spermidine synthase
MNALGRHIIVEFYNCHPDKINDVHHIEHSMVEAAQQAGATVINSTFHHFSPFGISGVVVIEQSHLSIHTWPEYQFASVDLFTCGETINPWISFDYLKKQFKAGHFSSLELHRGQLELLEKIAITVPKTRDKPRKKLPLPQYTRNIWFTERDNNIALSLRHTGDIVYSVQSPYQKVEILDTIAYGKTLIIDGMIMTTEKDEHVYHEMITHIPLLTHPNPKKVLIIGGGDGGTAREVLKHKTVEYIDLVEIDQTVIDACKQHLPTIASSLDNPKVHLHIEDGIQFINTCPEASYDIIIVDSTDPVGPAEGLFKPEFYQNVYTCLKPHGLMITQSESPTFNTKVFQEVYSCYREIYGYDNVFCYLAYIPTYPSGMWSFSYCSKDTIHPIHNLDDDKAAHFTQNHHLRYYNPALHKAAFQLPTFVQCLLDTNKTNELKTPLT